MPQPGTSVKVVDLTGHPAQLGHEGELYIRGNLVMDGGYWTNPRASLGAVDSEGWLHTGDLASIDSNGFIRVMGRKQTVITRGGGAY